VSIAAINGPEQVVIAGAEGPVETIAALFAERGVRTRRLPVSHAFHSPLMEPMLAAFERVAEAVTYRRPSMPLVSNVSGKLIDEGMSAAYWVCHVQEAVRFADGVKALHEAGADTFIELGPRPALLGQVPACLPDADPTLLASLPARREEVAGILEALGALWVRGYPMAWERLFTAGGRRVPLPTYPWQRKRYWLEVPAIRENAPAQGAKPGGEREREREKGPSKRDLPEWFYRPAWQERPTGAAEASKQGGLGSAWLIFADDDPVGEALGEHLAASGQSVTMVMAGDSYASISGQKFRIRPGVEEDYDALFTDLFRRRLHPQHIIHAWNLAETSSNQSPRQAFIEAQERGFYSLLFLTKALRRMKVTQEIWIEVLTRGMQGIDASETPLPETGTAHDTPGIVEGARDYDAIARAGAIARDAVWQNDLTLLAEAVRQSYAVQRAEGMAALPGDAGDVTGALAWKYCGGGFGGYAVFLFRDQETRGAACARPGFRAAEPYVAER
jgi:acyl transferase domain-containing protein